MANFQAPKIIPAESSLEEAINLAKSSLENSEFHSSCSDCVRHLIERLENKEEVSPLTWEYARAISELLPEGAERDALTRAIEVFAPEKLSNDAAITRMHQIDLAGLEKPFIDAISLFTQAFIKFKDTGIVVGLNEEKDKASTLKFVESLREFSQELNKFAAGINRDSTGLMTTSITALTSVLEYRSVLARYQADYLEYQASGAFSKNRTEDPKLQREVAAKILHLDFADKCYSLALQNPRLPRHFSDLFIGSSAVVPDVILTVLESARLTNPEATSIPESKELHNFHFSVLETLRNYGELIAGTGPSIKYEERNALASLDPTSMMQHVRSRNDALKRVEEILRNHPYGVSPQGKLLQEFTTSLRLAGELFLQSVNSNPKGVAEFNRQIDIKTKRILEVLDNPEFPRYFSLFFNTCCKFKVPKLPS